MKFTKLLFFLLGIGFRFAFLVFLRPGWRSPVTTMFLPEARDHAHQPKEVDDLWMGKSEIVEA